MYRISAPFWILDFFCWGSNFYFFSLGGFFLCRGEQREGKKFPLSLLPTPSKILQAWWSELKNKIARSLRNDEAHAYTLPCKAASSQATTVSKTCQINTVSNQQNYHVDGIKFYPIHPKKKSEGWEKIDKKVAGKKTKKIQNHLVRTCACLCFLAWPAV